MKTTASLFAIGAVVEWHGTDAKGRGAPDPFTIQVIEERSGSEYLGFKPEGGKRFRWRLAAECTNLSSDGSKPAKREIVRGVPKEVTSAMSKAGIKRNGCAIVAAARAAASPDAKGKEVASFVADAIKNMAALVGPDGKFGNGLRPSGVHYGPLEHVLDSMGIKHEPAAKPQMVMTNHDKHGIYGYKKDYEPTVARFLKDNPDISRCLIRSRGHYAWIDRVAVYGANMRYRVKEYVVVERL